MKIEKSNYPIFLLEELEDVVKDLREQCKRFDWLVEEQPGELLNEHEIEHEEIDVEKEFELLRFKYRNSGSFLFTIDDLELDSDDKASFTIYRSPKDDKSVDQDSFYLNKDEVKECFNEWIQLLERFDKIKLQDTITEQYEDEIYDLIKIIDKDADTTPFDTEQQIFILKYLDNAQKFLEIKKDEFETAEIVEEIADLKKEVTRLTKNSSMARLSRILAKSKKQSMELFKELMVMFKKEIMKKVLSGGFDAFEKLTTLLQSFN